MKMCGKPNQGYYDTIHHELGHVYTVLFYRKQPFEFQQTPAPAFHEAVGDALALSAMSPAHLHEMGLLNNVSSSKGN